MFELYYKDRIGVPSRKGLFRIVQCASSKPQTQVSGSRDDERPDESIAVVEDQEKWPGRAEFRCNEE
jgi:hypothetical protein